MCPKTAFSALQLAKGRTPPRLVTRAGTAAIETIVTFETAVGPCNGVVRLVSQGGTPRVWTLMTALDEIRGHEDPANGKRWQDVDWKRNFGGESWPDRRRRAVAYADRDPAVLVVGAAQDLAVSGAAEVSIIQNGPTLIVSLKEAQSPYALYDEDITFEDCDLLATSFPYPIYSRSHQQLTIKNAEADKDLLEGLKKRGFKLTPGPDGTGWQIMYQNRGGGYSFDGPDPQDLPEFLTQGLGSPPPKGPAVFLSGVRIF